MSGRYRLSDLYYSNVMTPLPEQLVYLLVILTTAHLLADFLLQTDLDASRKNRRRWYVFVKHGIIHAATAYLLVGNWTLWFPILTLAAVHVLIDLGKVVLRRAYYRNEQTEPRARCDTTLLALDQTIHLTVILGAALWGATLMDGTVRSTWWTLFGPDYVKSCVVLAGFALAVCAGAAVIGTLTEPLRTELTSPESRGHPPAAARGFTKGGRLIGQLERTLVYLLVLAGNLPAVGFLVAAKSVFRFGELRDAQQRKEAEYIIIGTLASFTWAVLVAFLTKYLLGVV